MSSQKLNLGITGLVTNSNNLMLQDGALASTSNINLDRKLATSRRGFTRHSTKSGLRRVTEYQDKLIAWKTDNTLHYYNSGWNAYSGTYTAPTDCTVKFTEANQNLYFTTAEGVKVLDAYNGSVYNTGMPKGLDGSITMTGGTGAQTGDTQVAYRVVWGSRDANDNLYLGAPSQRIISICPTGGTHSAIITFTIPAGITTSDFFQIYRSRESSSETTEPDDELQLVYEASPTAGEITTKSVTYTDVTPSTLKGAYLYTNANQEGIAESNDQPPMAKDITTFKGFTFFGGVTSRHSINLNLLAVDSGYGLVADDTITVNSMVFTAKASTTVASRQFKVFTSGSAAQNIEDTAKELVKVINQYSSNTSVYAYYLSGYADLPGQINIEERSLSGTAFTVSVSRATAWDIDNSGTATNKEYQAGLMWSKIQQPEHVPAYHLEQVGSKSYAIKRLVALKDALFILKEDGVFRLTGQDGKWTIETLDSSTVIIAPDTAVIINNQIFCLANQGIVTISDTGVAVIGEDINNSIQELIGLNYSSLQNYSFGVAYETDRKYILSLPSLAGDAQTTQQFIYNVFNSKWSRWTRTATCGMVKPSDDKLILVNDSYVYEERKSFTFTDYIDEQMDGYSVVSSYGTSVVLNSVLDITVGDLLYESASVYSAILSIDGASNTVVVNDTRTWAIGSVTIYKGIDCQLEWAPQYCNNSGIEKVFEQLIVMFKHNRFKRATMDFYTDVNGGWESVSISGAYGTSAWGGAPWGSLPWGGAARAKPTRVSVPRNKSRGQMLSIRFSCRMAYSDFDVQGLSLIFDDGSERQGARE